MDALTCINESCPRIGDQIYSMVKRPVCSVCGHDLYPWDDYEWTEDEAASEQMTLLSSDVPPDDYNGTGADFQSRLAGLANMKAPRKHSMREAPVVNQARRSAPPSDVFSCPPDLTGCPIAARPSVEVPLEMYQTWVHLAKTIDTEWMAYLKGRIEGERVIIDSMYFPNQIGTPSHVEAKDGEVQEGTVAAVHSHVGMDVFFSSEDVAHMNHHMELVVNRRGDLIANGRTTLACGRFHRGTADIKLVGGEELSAVVEELKGRLRRDVRYIGEAASSDKPSRNSSHSRNQSDARGKGNWSTLQPSRLF